MKPIKFLPFLFFVSALQVGCNTVPLQVGAEKVVISKQTPTENYTKLSDIQCEFGWNFMSTSGNVERCRNDLRNRATQIGATLVVIENETIGNAGCPNCVAMYGSAYRKAK